ncbi:MAG: ABC transporter ATP-binding protein [Neisseriaceae bacterium]|nr:ABC transporter ATP-binding protein [Neisseriaceae bacterium]
MKALLTRLQALPSDCRPLLRRMILWATFAAIMDGLCSLVLLPLIMAWMAQDTAALLYWAQALVLLTLIQALVFYWALVNGFACGGGLAGGLIRQLIQHLPKVSPHQLHQRARPEHLLRHQVMYSMGVPAHLIGPVIRALVTPATVIVGLALVDARLAALLGFAALGLVWLLQKINHRSHRLESLRHQAEQQVATQISHFSAQQALLRSSGRNNQASERLNHALSQLHQQTKRLLIQGLPDSLGVGLYVQGIWVALLWLGVWATQQHLISLGLLVATGVLLVRFIEPLSQLSHLGQALRQSKQAVSTLSAVFTLPPLPSPDHSALPPTHDLTVTQLNHQTEQGTPLLQDIHFKVKSGALVAIVGASGSGKSTLLSLLGRLMDPTTGTIDYGGTNIQLLSESSLSQSRHFVFQQNGVFPGTVEWNLRMAAPEAPTTHLLAALAAAAWPLSAPQLQTPVGSAGSALSGGERQRLCLARAFLSSAPILLLDEPTASLDALSSRHVQRTLAQLKQRRTTLVVTHDAALAELADWVLIMDQGTIIAQGTPQDLALKPEWQTLFCTH